MPLDKDNFKRVGKTRHTANGRFDIAALVARRDDDGGAARRRTEVPQRAAYRVMAQAEHVEQRQRRDEAVDQSSQPEQPHRRQQSPFTFYRFKVGERGKGMHVRQREHVLRWLRHFGPPPRSATIVIPARNERGNIESAIRRMPRFAEALEIIFVEGHSRDDTWNEIERVVKANPQLDIKALHQPGKGKADAVYAGFAAATGDVLMILDADLTVPPEQLPKFWEAICSGKAEFVNGTRLVYQIGRAHV